MKLHRIIAAICSIALLAGLSATTAEAKKKDLKALLKYGQLPLLDIIIRKDSVFNALDVPVEVVNFIEKL